MRRLSWVFLWLMGYGDEFTKEENELVVKEDTVET
jgi:hypothetical protein